MNNRFKRHSASHSKGITLIEILMVLGLLGIVLSFAIPSASGVANKAEMKAVFENVQFSVQAARKTARMIEKPVSMDISSPGQGTTQTVSFSSPGEHTANSNLQIQEFSLPAGIVLITDHDSFVFNEKGLVEEPGQVALVSTIDETLTSTFDIK